MLIDFLWLRSVDFGNVPDLSEVYAAARYNRKGFAKLCLVSIWISGRLGTTDADGSSAHFMTLKCKLISLHNLPGPLSLVSVTGH
jgi:hypothetical protein